MYPLTAKKCNKVQQNLSVSHLINGLVAQKYTLSDPCGNETRTYRYPSFIGAFEAAQEYIKENEASH